LLVFLALREEPQRTCSNDHLRAAFGFEFNRERVQVRAYRVGRDGQSFRDFAVGVAFRYQLYDFSFPRRQMDFDVVLPAAQGRDFAENCCGQLRRVDAVDRVEGVSELFGSRREVDEANRSLSEELQETRIGPCVASYDHPAVGREGAYSDRSLAVSICAFDRGARTVVAHEGSDQVAKQ